MNSWISFVKDYAAKNNMKYNEALKSPGLKAAYNKSKGKSAKPVSKKKRKGRDAKLSQKPFEM